MKKILITLAIICLVNPVNAIPTLKNLHVYQHSEYQRGYRRGKNDAYNHVAKTVFFVGVATITGVMIYQAGKQSRWGVNENGVTYRF